MKTTSIFQTFRLNSASRPEDALLVRPPQNLRAFRCTISIHNYTGLAEVRIANYANANDFGSILLSTGFKFDTNTVAVPGTDNSIGTNYSSISSIVLDRRGVGYMTDNFYIWDVTGSATVVSFIWEGEID